MSQCSMGKVSKVFTHLAYKNGPHFAEGIFKSIFMTESVCILNQVLLNVSRKRLIDCESALDQAILGGMR